MNEKIFTLQDLFKYTFLEYKDILLNVNVAIYFDAFLAEELDNMQNAYICKILGLKILDRKQKEQLTSIYDLQFIFDSQVDSPYSRLSRELRTLEHVLLSHSKMIFDK